MSVHSHAEEGSQNPFCTVLDLPPSRSILYFVRSHHIKRRSKCTRGHYGGIFFFLLVCQTGEKRGNFCVYIKKKKKKNLNFHCCPYASKNKAIGDGRKLCFSLGLFFSGFAFPLDRRDSLLSKIPSLHCFFLSCFLSQVVV